MHRYFFEFLVSAHVGFFTFNSFENRDDKVNLKSNVEEYKAIQVKIQNKQYLRPCDILVVLRKEVHDDWHIFAVAL